MASFNGARKPFGWSTATKLALYVMCGSMGESLFAARGMQIARHNRHILLLLWMLLTDNRCCTVAGVHAFVLHDFIVLWISYKLYDSYHRLRICGMMNHDEWEVTGRLDILFKKYIPLLFWYGHYLPHQTLQLWFFVHILIRSDLSAWNMFTTLSCTFNLQV